MISRERTVVGMVFAALLISAAFGTACGEPQAADPTPVKTWKITPAASGGSVTPVPSPEGTAIVVGSATPGADGGARVEIAGVGSVFDVTDVSASAGAITIVFDNQDGGVVHNIHFFKGKNAKGEDVGETELEPGPIVQELKLDLQAGTYFYLCDAHPVSMKGTLEVG